MGDDIASSKIRSASWLKQVTVEISNDVLIWNLGDGESEVLSLALEDDRYIAAIDDRAARNCARTLAVRTMGTGAILVLAKQKGYLESVERTLSRLREVGLYISDDIVEMLKKQAGE